MDPAVLQAMQEELEIDFDAASTFLAMHVQDKAFTDAVKLELYGLFKQATVGPCNVSKPFNPLDFKARSKWSAWNGLGSISQEEAMVRYIEVLTKALPEWRETAGGGAPQRSGAGGPMGPVISTLAGGVGPGAEGAGGDAHGEGTLHGAASRGDVAGVTRCLRQGADVNGADDVGCTALHWASDKGHVEAARYLVEMGADVNAPDEVGCRPLHLAVAGGHAALVSYIASLEAAELAAEDEDGRTPLLQAIDESNEDAALALLKSPRGHEALGADAAAGRAAALAACQLKRLARVEDALAALAAR